MSTLSIGEVARRSGVGVETVRFYERGGMIEEPPRRPSGYRQYPEDVIVRIQFIRRAKELGFTLKEIKELLSLRMDSSTQCEDIRQRSITKIDDIETRIAVLERMKAALVKLTAACDGQGSVSDCPILDFLDVEEDQ